MESDRRGRVLIVDDEVVTRDLLHAGLERAGYEVTAVRDGREALEALRAGSHQLVVSDWEMPRMNGLELCRAVRSGEFDRYIYFIMLTSHHQSQDVLDGLDAGADDFVTKPFNPREVAVRLKAGQRLLTLETAEMTIFMLAKLAESRDPETGAHLERVRSFCRSLAEELARAAGRTERVSEEYVQLIYQTSPLHDIGKVAIPDAVLLKAGPLTAEETDVMRTHAQHGARTLEAAMKRYPLAGFVRMARDIALTHHERYDGSGYPTGLIGEAIPLAGRIVALADVYDALTSKRVYKPAMDHEKARKIIREASGTHFDPRVVDAFTAREREFCEIRRQFADEHAEGTDEGDEPVGRIGVERRSAA